ncbi:hypothetical protein EJV47_15115 [Hymenobacter gummosus]|uniref:DUF885 family protein n=1 Tax=Hymenobacter gummosus TaxID=1776032 RepID=A0A3S0JGA1_9BACT|nr:hypothetical protein [Hymenobacter gummosus]RTQ48921.1 hypothetical protein EJV47_15115 [Hymenobacter gummosus]
MKMLLLVPLAALLVAACAPRAAQQASPELATAAAEEKAVAATPGGEFGPTDNGLIYPPATIRQLRRIVDSLNYRFTTCDLTRRYRAQSQARAHYVQLAKGNIRQARKELASGISYEEFLRKYPRATTEKELLVTRHFSPAEGEEKAQLEFSSVPLNYHDGHYINLKENIAAYSGSLRQRWVIDYQEKTEYSDESIEAFYFVEEFRQPVLPEAYARLVQYTDCMVDTTAQVFTAEARRAGRFYGDDAGKDIAKFLAYTAAETQKPELQGEDYEAHSQALQAWETRRFAVLDPLAATPQFRQLFRAALAEAQAGQGADDEFEEYVSRYDSPRTALQLKRNRIVVGDCSMDNSPRLHALSIAKLAAESVSWEVFLRAHLDIMNDRFERVSDGSYAWRRRQTYIRELEVLDINVLDLLLGISLRVQNPSPNHYYGSIGRLGRALAETEHAPALEAKLRTMVADAQLDDYNRLLLFYLYRNYVGSLADSARQQQARPQLLAAAQTLPPYLARRIRLDE